MDVSLKQSIEQLSALAPYKRLEALKAIRDPDLLQQVMLGLPVEVYAEVIRESFLDNLKRNVQERMGEQAPHNLAA